MANLEAPVRENIILTGFMGTGKSTVGRLLAARLGCTFVDTDALITTRYGPIPEIFAVQGEAAFRRMEREIAAELGGQSGLVIATGGGMLLDEVNVDALAANGRIFCLTASPHTILTRVSAEAGTRPLLNVLDPAARIGELLAVRAAAYGRFAQVATDGVGVTAVVEAIIAQL